MVAESDFEYEEIVGNEANGPTDPRDPRSRFRAYPTRIEMPQMSSITSLLLLFPRRVYENQVSKQICDNVDLGMDLVGRSLTQDETEAFVSQAELLVKGPRQGAMIGLVAANVLSFGVLKRAIIRPHTLNPANMSLRDFPFVKVGVSSGFGIFTGAVFGNVWAAANASRNLLSDDRLKKFREDRKYQDPDVILRRVRERAMMRKGYAPGIMADGKTRGSYRSGQQMGDSSPQSGYDTSTVGPYSGSSNEVSPTLVDDGTGGSKIINDINTRRQRDEYNTQARPYFNQDNSSRGSSAQHYAGQHEQDIPAANVDGGMDFFDADSATSSDPDSPRYQQSPATSGQSKSGSGSAWDRIRHAAQRENGVSVPAQRDRQQQINAAAQGLEFEGYMSSGGRTQGGFDKYEGYASKEEAQKKFNELLEKERAIGSDVDRLSGPRCLTLYINVVSKSAFFIEQIEGNRRLDAVTFLNLNPYTTQQTSVMSLSNTGSGASTPNPRFTSQSDSAEDLLKSQTVGLVHLSDFRKRRAEVLEQKEREAHGKSLGLGKDDSKPGTPGTSTEKESDAKSQKEPPKKKKKKLEPKAKLYYNDDDEENEEEAVMLPVTTAQTSKSTTPAIEDITKPDAVPNSSVRRIRANPNVSLPPPKLLTKSAMTAEARARDALRKEFLALQERVKNTEIIIPFIFYDGTNIPAGSVKVKKGDPVWLFLDRCRKVGATLGVGGGRGRGKGRREYRKEWARVGVDDLLLVRGNVIIPHHYEFYYFIANRVPDFSGRPGALLFDYSDTAPLPSAAENEETQGLTSTSSSSTEQGKPLEGQGANPTITKVVDRRWYERNKHIFPASLWREYEPGKEFEESMTTSHFTVDQNPQAFTLISVLLNPDDAVSTILNPTEDYKTSVLSGLDPNTVMECAGRALAFWTYQTTQEIFYQEYLGKGLTEKYAALSNQMDKVVHDANSEISSLQNRIQDMQISQEQLLKKNQELVELYRDKSKKHAQVTNLYNILKSRAMRTQIQTAATDSISQTLDSLGSRRGHEVNQLSGRSAHLAGNSNHYQNIRPSSAQHSPEIARAGTAMGHYGLEAAATRHSG
ncbi:hypothetical protein KEM54_000042, partial [Ascosphaera aggregata]